MNINEPISNPKLVNIIEALKNNNATQEDFFDELLQLKLLCPAYDVIVGDINYIL